MIEHRNLQRHLMAIVADRESLAAESQLDGRTQVVLAHRLQHGPCQLIGIGTSKGLAEKLQHDSQFAHADHCRHGGALGIPGLFVQRSFFADHPLGNFHLALQLQGIERLQDEILSPCFIAKQAGFYVVTCRDEENRNVLRIPVILEMPADRIAIHARQRQIKQDQIRTADRHMLQAGLAVVEMKAVVGCAQCILKNGTNDRVIINDEQGQLCAHLHPKASDPSHPHKPIRLRKARSSSL